MRYQEARTLFGLTNGYTVEIIKQKFIDAVKLHHPDNGGLGDMDKLKAARDLLIAAKTGDLTCKQCKGRGSIPARFGRVVCGRCEGECVVMP